MADISENKLERVNYVTEEDVKHILKSSGLSHVVIDSYAVTIASKNMMGFMCDYWRLEVMVAANNDTTILSFFIKAVSRSNAAKAIMVKELKLYEKELMFYTLIAKSLDIPGIKPWCASIITALDDAMVFQDLNALQYKLRNKFERFDTAHTLEALRTLSRFHGCSIIFESKRRQQLQRQYSINDEFAQYLDEGGYKSTETWYRQCMIGALETVKMFSKYRTDENIMKNVEDRWFDIWDTAWRLSAPSKEQLSVICHRDLWNNNILFHYRQTGDSLEPDDCKLVDFQAVRCQPPAGDVMLLLYCNLEPKFREENLTKFLDFYYEELKSVLYDHGILIYDALTRDEFLSTAEELRLWAVVVCACLMPQMWIDDDLTTKTFCDTAQFNEILSKDKATFIKKMMLENEDYKVNVMNVFDEIVERFCI